VVLAKTMLRTWNLLAMEAVKTEFEQAVEWFFNLTNDERVYFCIKTNENTPYSIIDTDLLKLWKEQTK